MCVEGDALIKIQAELKKGVYGSSDAIDCEVSVKTQTCTNPVFKYLIEIDNYSVHAIFNLSSVIICRM